MLDVTGSGTVIARAHELSPPREAPADPDADTIDLDVDDLVLEIEEAERQRKLTVRPEPTSGELRVTASRGTEDDEDEVEIDVDEDEFDVFFGAPSQTRGRSVHAMDRGAVRSSDGRLWPAPPPGETVVQSRPEPPLPSVSMFLQTAEIDD